MPYVIYNGKRIYQTTTSSVRFYYGSQSKNTLSTTFLDEFKKIEFGKKIYVNDQLYHSFTADGAFDADSRLYLFRAYKEYSAGVVGSSSIQRKTVEIYNGTTLQSKLQPSLNLSGQFCMWDEVSKTYKTNIGAGYFKGGSLITETIDNLLIQYAADNVSSATIDFTCADNGARSSSSDIAVNILIANGCTVLTNP